MMIVHLIESRQKSLCAGILEAFTELCLTPRHRLYEIVEDLVADMEEGLETDRETTLKMLPSFVDVLPTGNERGLFYALDLGGTNFRVLRVEFDGKQNGIIKQEREISVPQNLMAASGKELFQFIATELQSFVKKETHGLKTNQKGELGFTFSFPVNQTSINSGTLVHWTKGFTCHGVVGKDVVQFLEEAMTAVGLGMRVTALVNDTVGTLAGGRYANQDTMIAIILGTGTNACYVERAETIKKWKGVLPISGEMVINTEWGNFDSPRLPITYADVGLDRESVNPGEQIFEKLISGMYMGDIVRRVMLKMASDSGIFGDPFPAKLSVPYILSTPHMSKIHGDHTHELKHVAEVLENIFDINETSVYIRNVVYQICEVVCHRGARLAAAGIVAILKKIGYPHHPDETIVIAMDGGLYENYAQFRSMLHTCVIEMLGLEIASHVSIQLSKDGSGIGAALIAASYSRT